MKINILSGTIAILGLALLSPQAFAVNNSIQAVVPFEFVVGDKALPPARYTFDIATDTGPGVLTIRTLQSGERVMFDTTQLAEKADPKIAELVFDTVGNKTYLTEVWGVVDSGRAVKHLVEGQPLERAPEASRRHVPATRIVDPREQKNEK